MSERAVVVRSSALMLAWMLACGGAPATIATTGPGVMGMTGGDADGTSETADAGSTDDSTTAAAPTTSTSDPTSSTGDGTSTGSTTGSTTGANDTSTTGPAPPPELVATPITDMNRAYVEMHGGWGHHLRGLMRAADDRGRHEHDGRRDDPDGVDWQRRADDNRRVGEHERTDGQRERELGVEQRHEHGRDDDGELEHGDDGRGERDGEWQRDQRRQQLERGRHRCADVPAADAGVCRSAGAVGVGEVR